MGSHEQQIAEFGSNDDFWLFGYGYVFRPFDTSNPVVSLTQPRSLIWKPPPHFGIQTSSSYARMLEVGC